jgi:6-phosphogluconolactonase
LRLVCAGDAGAAARAAAEEVVRAAVRAVAERGRCAIALAGGSTPRRLYELLATDPLREQVPWGSVHAFFGDERHVPPDHPDSNARMAREALLERVPVASVHRVRGELPDAEAAAEAYERDLAAFFGGSGPRFDLVLLGLGDDGHTASLSPGSAALEERGRAVAAPWVPRLAAHRITLTLPALNAARAVVFVVTGADKAPAVARTLVDGATPAARVRPEAGELVWIVDAAAAAQLPEAIRSGTV